MEYLLLIYDSEANFAKMSKTDLDAMYADYGKFTQSIQESGNHRAGQQPGFRAERAEPSHDTGDLLDRRCAP